MGLDVHKQKDLLFAMLRIRRIEEAIASKYPEQKMRTPVHLSIGQESVAAVVGMQLTPQDFAVSTHRSHAHYLAKGGSLKAMIAEIYGKVTGCCRGRGGSMHLIDRTVGFMGSTAIVGNTIPIGVGLGLSIALSKSNALSCIFLGDGAIEEGVFYESLNFAVLKNLPILFICENNRYSVYSHFEKRQPKHRNIYEIAKAFGAEVEYGNGYDVMTSYSITERAIASIRKDPKPYFLEFETYRWLEHCGPNYDNDIGYRTETEFLSWQRNDPIKLFKEQLIESQSLSELDYQEMEAHINSEINMALEFAESSPFPDSIEAITGQYNDSPKSIKAERVSSSILEKGIQICDA